MELFLLGVGLSMDAMAVAVAKGLAMGKPRVQALLIIAAFFGGFQALMVALGWLVGSWVLWLVEPVGAWIAFGILVLLGIKMLVEGLSSDRDEADATTFTLNIKELAILALATSIDALAAGVALSLVEQPMIFAAAIIGITTFVLSAIGVLIGCAFGARFKRPATVVGGVVLILIGIKILVEHLTS